MLDLIEVELTQISKSFAIVGGFIIIYGLLSYVVRERVYLSEPLILVAVGIIVGPHVLNWVNPFTWGTEETYHEVTFQISRLLVGIQVMFTGISLPDKYLWKRWGSISVILTLIMICAWFTTGLLIWGLIPGIDYVESLVIASAVTPTDPVLSASITAGRFAEEHVQEHVRHILLAESGANDGLGYPFLFIAVYLMARTGQDYGETVGDEVWRWFYSVIIYEVLLSAVYGAVIGFVFKILLRWAAERKLIDMSNFFSYGVGLALFTLGTAGLFGTDDVLACFIAGNTFTWDDWFRLRAEENDFQEIIDMLLNAVVFIYIGLIIPWDAYSDETLQLTGWRVVVLGICTMLLRRPPWMLAFYRLIPALKNVREGLFAGWFGPIGVSAVYYLEVALQKIDDNHGTRTHLRQLLTPVTLFIIFSSVLTHGITIPLVYFGPHVLKHSRTKTLDSWKQKDSWGKIRAMAFPTKDQDPYTIQEDAEAMDRTIRNHMGSTPFSRVVHGEEPPDLAIRHGHHEHSAHASLYDHFAKHPKENFETHSSDMRVAKGHELGVMNHGSDGAIRPDVSSMNSSAPAQEQPNQKMPFSHHKSEDPSAMPLSNLSLPPPVFMRSQLDSKQA